MADHRARFQRLLGEIEQEIVDAQLLQYLSFRLEQAADAGLGRWGPSLRGIEERTRARIARLREDLRREMER